MELFFFFLMATSMASAADIPPQHELVQWRGYLSQLGSTATIHVASHILARQTNHLYVQMFIHACKHEFARAAQRTISNDVFKFTQSDWAASSKNYGYFWAWLGALSALEAHNCNSLTTLSLGLFDSVACLLSGYPTGQ